MVIDAHAAAQNFALDQEIKNTHHDEAVL